MKVERVRYRHGPDVPKTAYMRWIEARVRWAARMSLVKATVARSIPFHWVRFLDCRDKGDTSWGSLFGRCAYRSGRPVVFINVEGVGDDHWLDTATHEFAHACLAPVEGLIERTDDTGEDAHSAAWAGMYGEMYRWVIDRQSQGPQQ